MIIQRVGPLLTSRGCKSAVSRFPCHYTALCATLTANGVQAQKQWSAHIDHASNERLRITNDYTSVFSPRSGSLTTIATVITSETTGPTTFRYIQ